MLDFLRKNTDCAVQIWSMEDPPEDVFRDYVALFTGINSERQQEVKGNVLTDEEKEKIKEADIFLEEELETKRKFKKIKLEKAQRVRGSCKKAN